MVKSIHRIHHWAAINVWLFQIIFTLGLFVSTEVAATKQAMHRWISNNNCGSTWINYIIGVEHITN